MRVHLGYSLGLEYGNRKHWELTVRRWRISRWCPGAPCHLPGAAAGRHWMHVSRWEPYGAAVDR